jgi:hypothetical protein
MRKGRPSSTRTQDLFHLINESNADQASQDVLAQTGDSGFLLVAIARVFIDSRSRSLASKPSTVNVCKYNLLFILTVRPTAKWLVVGLYFPSLFYPPNCSGTKCRCRISYFGEILRQK